MKKYIKAYLAFFALTSAISISLAFMLMAFAFMTGGAEVANSVERSTWLPWASEVVWFVAGLFAFKFSVKNFMD